MKEETCPLETHAEECTGTPLVLIESHILVVEDRVVHDKSGTSKEAWGEVVNDSKALIEDHVEMNMLCLFFFTVHNHLIAIIDHNGRQDRGVEQPFTPQHEVIAVAAANTYMPKLDSGHWSIGSSLRQLVVGFDTTALIADTEQP